MQCLRNLKPSFVTPNFLSTQFRMVTNQDFKYKLKTKNACKKRFKLTSSGNVKFYPSRLHGKPRILNKKNLTGIYYSRY